MSDGNDSCAVLILAGMGVLGDEYGCLDGAWLHCFRRESVTSAGTERERSRNGPFRVLNSVPDRYGPAHTAFGRRKGYGLSCLWRIAKETGIDV